MSTKKDAVTLPFNAEGFQKVNDRMDFVPSFKNEGDYLHGIFRGVKSFKNKRGQDQTCWIVAVIEGLVDGKPLMDEILLMSEKSAMNTARLELYDGQEFAVIYRGQDEGTKFKKFDIFKK